MIVPTAADCDDMSAGLSRGFFAWIQWQRRLLVRCEYYPANSLVQLVALCVLLKQF